MSYRLSLTAKELDTLDSVVSSDIACMDEGETKETLLAILKKVHRLRVRSVYRGEE